MAMTQAESYADLWTQHRDYWKPCTPDDIHGLREDREFEPPSRAHRKRLARDRPEVTVARPAPPVDQSARLRINQASAHGARIKALLGYVKPIVR